MDSGLLKLGEPKYDRVLLLESKLPERPKGEREQDSSCKATNDTWGALGSNPRLTSVDSLEEFLELRRLFHCDPKGWLASASEIVGS